MWIASSARGAATWLVATDDPDAIAHQTAAAGLELVEHYANVGMALYRRAPGAALQQLAADPPDELGRSGLSAVADLPVRLAAPPNDPMFINQGAISAPSADADIHLIEAWDLHTDASTVVVAVLDTGVNTTHPDLVDNLWRNEAELSGEPGVDDDGNGKIDDIYGWNTVNNNNDVNDAHGHGTGVAGILAATGNNEVGISGTCWNARIMPVRCFDTGQYTSTAAIIAGFDYVLSFPEVRVVNASWGLGDRNQALELAVQRLGERGVVVVAAAGNDGVSLDVEPFYPASFNFSNVISVSAVNTLGGLASFSSFGWNVTVAAPGEILLTTSHQWGYTTRQGTSFAAPFVSGAVALLRAQRPDLEPAEIKHMVIESSRRTGRLEDVPIEGGLLDVYSLFRSAQQINAVPASIWSLY